MAIQGFTDYSKVPLQDSPAATLFEDVLKGYKMQQEPGKMALEKKKSELANQLKQVEIEQKPAQMDLERRYKEALIKAAEAKANNAGKSTSSKFNGAVANEESIWNLEHPGGAATPEEHKEHVTKLKNALKVSQDAITTSAERRRQIMKAEAYNKTPTTYKSQQMALGAGLGLDAGETAKRLEAGDTISDIAKEKGIDPKTIVPVHPMANENIKQGQIKSSLISELVNMEGNLNSIQGKYSRKFLGYSPKQIVQALKNENPDEQGMILAARNLAPEVSAIRAKIATNGMVGIEAIRELTDKSLSNIKVFEPLVSQEAREAMEKYTNKLILDAANAYKQKMESYSQIQPEPGQQSAPSVPNQMMSNALNNNQPNQANNNFDFAQYPVAGGH